MNKKFVFGFLAVYVCLAALITLWFHSHNITLLNPQGWVALQERDLMITAVAIMLLLAIPVFIFLLIIPMRYKVDNAKARYTPEWTGNRFLKFLWWAIPTTIACVLFVIVWVSSHRLDPYNTIAAQAKPITVEVVALQWKWLFIYPEQGIATVNFLQFPVHTPVNFRLTADAPMTTFWIPSLGSQIYTMSAMETQLHLIGNTTGDFPGETTEINGSGYADMRFTTRVSSPSDFDTWVQQVRNSSKTLDLATYNRLAKPSENTPVIYYASFDHDLYNTIMMKYMKPNPSMSPMQTKINNDSHDMEGMEMK